MAISEAELNDMTKDLHELNEDVGMPALRASLAEMTEGLKSGGRKETSRRSFLFGVGGAVAGGAALLTIGATPGLAAAASTAPLNVPSPEKGLNGDLKLVAINASLENLAVYAYNAGLQAATAGKLGTVPPAIATFATTAKAQHTQHAAAWNAVLTAAHKKPVTATEPTLTPVILKAFGKVTDVAGLGALALMLEDAAAATYQADLAKFKNSQAIGAAATIQPVEMQHTAILNYVLGTYPVPAAFSATSGAVL